MFVSTSKIDVRYAETDQMGIVYHANYLVWMEVGRTQLITDLGFNYADLENEGIVSPVLDIQVSYKKPLHYGQKAIVKTWIEEYNGFRTTYGYEIFNDEGELAVTGTTQHVCVKKDTFRPISFKKHNPIWHEAYEKAKKQIVNV